MSPLAPGRTEALSSEEIVDAALALVDVHGVEGLTMRRLAEELGVTPMAPYLHFESKGALLRAVCARVWAEAAAGPARMPDDPNERIVAMCRHLRATILRHPGVAPVLVAEPAPTARLAAAARGVASEMEAAGFTAERAGVAYYALATWTLGASVLAAGYRRATEMLDLGGSPRGDALAKELGAGSDEPGVRSVAAALAPVDDALFDAGLRALLAGLRAA